MVLLHIPLTFDPFGPKVCFPLWINFLTLMIEILDKLVYHRNVLGVVLEVSMHHKALKK